jgi:hypothetical protein
MLGWDLMPEEVIKQISDSNCKWDYFGIVIYDEFYADPEVGWRNQFFIMKSSGEWKFRIVPNRLIFEGYWHPYVSPKPKKRFSLFGGMKIYNKMGGKILWTNENDFVRRFSSREPLSQEKLLEKVITKYETIFKWMLVGYNKKEIFWENIKRDAAKGVLDCYEVRQEEIVNSFTDVTRKYWKNQRGIAARSHRTMLFRSQIFKHRRSSQSGGCEIFGTNEGSFAKKVLYYVRSEMLKGAGNTIEGESWEEALIYAIASNGDFFGTGMMKFNEKMLYKKFIKSIEIPPIAKLDAELLFDIKLYSRFLAIYISKMKKDWAVIDEDMNGKGMKKARDDYEVKNILKWDQETRKRRKHLEKHPEDDDQSNDGLCEVCQEIYKEKVMKKAKRKKRKGIVNCGVIVFL